jgi:hypothetical protein
MEIQNIMKDRIITSDTDSLFFELKDLIVYRDPNVDFTNREQVVPIGLKITAEYQEKTKPFLQDLCKKLFNCDNEYFELKQEVLIERAYFAGKRRYAQFIVNKEGVPTEELDIKGMDVMKSNMTPMYAVFGKGLIMDIMYGKPKKEIDKKIQDFRNEVKNTHYSKLAKPTGVKQINNYIASKPASGQIFSKLGNKCPINTKASIWYNDLLRFKGLDKQYPCITEGDKINVGIREANGKIVVSISDTGSGISEEDLPHLFDRFFKGKSSKPGTGLGLAIVKGILELHHSEYKVESKLGEGTRFTFTLNI